MTTVRLARPADFARIAELTLAAYRAVGLPADSDYWPYLADTAGRAVPPTEVWAVEDDGQILGSVTWCPPGSPHQEIAGPNEGEFRTLAVDPACAGRGAGGVLLDAVLSRARADGLSAVVLTTASPMTIAQGMYVRSGFVRTPALDRRSDTGILLPTYRLELTPRA